MGCALISKGIRRLFACFALLAPAAVVALGDHAFAEQAKAPPQVTAASVFVINADTGQPLYEKNPDKSFRILSLTKLITAYVLMQRMGGQLSDSVTIVPSYLVPGSTAGLRKGDIWSLENLLYGMLLVSGKDASLAIADHVGRALLAEEKKKGTGISRFVKEMGPAAAALGATHTKFADPYGISPSNVSTARDVGLIGSTVFRDQRLLPFWQCARRTLSIGGPKPRTFSLMSTIELLGEDNILGAKTGSHVSKNIYHLVAGWQPPNGQTIVAVVLGSADHPGRYNGIRAILAALPLDFPVLAVRQSARRPSARAARSDRLSNEARRSRLGRWAFLSSPPANPVSLPADPITR